MSTEGVEAQSAAYQNLGRGIQNLGTSIAEATPKIAPKVAAVLDDWQHARTDAQDVIHANQQDIMRQDFQTEMGAQLDTLPADQRPAYFQKQLPVLHEALATVPVSSRRAKLEAQRQTQWERQTYAAIYQQSTRQSIEQGAQIGVTNYYKKLTSGDVEGAHQGLAELRATHLLSDAQYQEHFIKGDALLLRQHSDRYLAENPRGMLADIDESQKSGQPVPGFRWPPEQTRSYRRQAQAAVIQREVETGYSTHQAIVKGEITDESTLRQRAGQDLPPSRLASLTRLLHDDPDYQPAALTELRTAVRAFHPGSDRDQSTYAALQERIESTVPRAMQAAFTDELHQAWQTRGQNDPASATRLQQAAYFRQIDSLARKGFLGDDDATPQRAEFIKTDLERFMKAKPEANSRELKDRLRDLAQDNGLARRAANLLRERSSTLSR